VFVAPTHLVGVHATDHSCVSRSSASRFRPTLAVESSYIATVWCIPDAPPFCEHRPKPSYGYRDGGSNDPLTRSRRVDPKKLSEVHVVLVAEALAPFDIPP
jgi:hypothetical protein